MGDAAGGRLDVAQPRLVSKIDGVLRSEARRRLAVIRGDEKLYVLADALGVTERFVGMLLRGIRQPSIELATKIYLAFGIHAELWGLEESELSVRKERSTPG